MYSAHVNISESIYSFDNAQTAETVLHRSLDDLRHCRRFTDTAYGYPKVFTWVHTGTAVYSRGQLVEVRHKIATTLPGYFEVDLIDARVGGEVMWVGINSDNPGSRSDAEKISAALTRFRVLISGYRASHPLTP